jgi:F420-0:gamma-glutamyl ligase
MQHLVISAIENVPVISPNDSIGQILIAAIKESHVRLHDNDILSVASKVVSIAENRYIDLNTVKVSQEALLLHNKFRRKKPEVLQLILEAAGGDSSNLRLNDGWIGAKNHIGRVLTSAGIDKATEDSVLLLPSNPDASARNIGDAIFKEFGLHVGVLITDSDGREGIAGATQLCVGLYGVPPIRKQYDSEETVCDMLAAACGLIMGQRGNNIPTVVVSGFQYIFDVNAKLADAF